MRISTEPGLRERKKERTRQLIADTARELFAARGFDRVTVAEIARAAEVAEQTVYNYFPTKEDLVFHRLESFEEELLDAIRNRAPGESALEAFGRFVLEPRGMLADPGSSERLKPVLRMITESPALLKRERQALGRYTEALAALLAEETGAAADAVEPKVVANALMGVHRALLDFVRPRAIAGVPARRLAREMRAEGERALAVLARGLADYATAGPEAPTARSQPGR
jgi:AcrR family transcriptional regulator